jgi:hypothetical protein
MGQSGSALGTLNDTSLLFRVRCQEEVKFQEKFDLTSASRKRASGGELVIGDNENWCF